MTRDNERSATVTSLDTADTLGRLIARAGRRERPPTAIEASVREAVNAAWREETAKRSRWRRHLLAAAAAIAVLAAGVSWQLAQRSQPAAQVEVAMLDEALGSVSVKAPDGTLHAASISGTVLHARDGVWTGADSGARLTIGDALELRVAPSSRITLRGPDRLSLELGAVFVDSGTAADALVIDTPLGEVTHVGTRYLVRVEPDTTTVAVRDGRVAITSRSSTVTADREEQVVLRSGGHIIDRSSVPTYGRLWSWVDALAEPVGIEGLPLARFLEWVALETGRRLDFADAQVANAAASTVLHGSIAGLSPDEALQAVLATTDFEAEFADERLVIRGIRPH